MHAHMHTWDFWSAYSTLPLSKIFTGPEELGCNKIHKIFSIPVISPVQHSQAELPDTNLHSHPSKMSFPFVAPKSTMAMTWY